MSEAKAFTEEELEGVLDYARVVLLTESASEGFRENAGWLERFGATLCQAEAERDAYKRVVDAFVNLSSDHGLGGTIRLYKIRAEASEMEPYRAKRLAVVAALEALLKVSL